jgi:hypothetical protein
MVVSIWAAESMSFVGVITKSSHAEGAFLQYTEAGTSAGAARVAVACTHCPTVVAAADWLVGSAAICEKLCAAPPPSHSQHEAFENQLMV